MKISHVTSSREYADTAMAALVVMGIRPLGSVWSEEYQLVCHIFATPSGLPSGQMELEFTVKTEHGVRSTGVVLAPAKDRAGDVMGEPVIDLAQLGKGSGKRINPGG